MGMFPKACAAFSAYREFERVRSTVAIYHKGQKVGDVVLGDLKIEGKTKEVWRVEGNPRMVVVVSNDWVTAGNGAKKEEVPGKGEVSTRTTCAVFKMLHSHDIPIAFQRQLDERSFLSLDCDMLKLEVVVRRMAPPGASILKRNPKISAGEVIESPLFELFLKTNDLKWGPHDLPEDDPYIEFKANALRLHHPKQPLTDTPFLILPPSEVLPKGDEAQNVQTVIALNNLAVRIFLLHEEALKAQGFDLLDEKQEFGLVDGTIKLSDVVDADSIRVYRDGVHFDKEPFRGTASAAELMPRWRMLMEASEKFAM